MLRAQPACGIRRVLGDVLSIGCSARRRSGDCFDELSVRQTALHSGPSARYSPRLCRWLGGEIRDVKKGESAMNTEMRTNPPPSEDVSSPLSLLLIQLGGGLL